MLFLKKYNNVTELFVTNLNNSFFNYNNTNKNTVSISVEVIS